MTILAAAGLAVAAYLTSVRLLGEAPACGPFRGCDTVAASEYATVLGMPVALLGLGFSIVLVVLAVAWWRHGDRRALYAVYAFGLIGVAVVAYLTYLELFVIEAICVWCVTYATTVVAGWIVAVLAVRHVPDRTTN
jgi:uncharacterized membrane protein